MTFSFNNAIPAANNAPANDQPLMLQNNQSTASIIAVDHVGFNTAGGGQHLQVTFNGIHVPGVAPTGLNSIEFTNVGVAKPASSQLFYQNQDVICHLNPIKAWAYVSNGAIVANQSSNVNSVTIVSTDAQIVLTTGATNSVNYAVIGISSTDIFTVAITGASTFNIGLGAFAATATFSFIVLQI